MKVTRDLELKLIVEDGQAAVEVYEPETGEFMRCVRSIDNLGGLTEQVGVEIDSWIYLMLDETEENQTYGMVTD